MSTVMQRCALVLALSTFAAAASAAPVILRTSFYTDVIGPNATYGGPGGSAAGNYYHLDTRASSSYPSTDMTAVATYPSPANTLNLTFYEGPIFTEKNFDILFLTPGYTGTWNLAVTDPTGTASGSFAAIAEPEFLPLVLNLDVSGNGATPTIAWDLPDLTGFDVNDIFVRATDVATNVQIFQSLALPNAATSFTMPSGVLSIGKAYEFRVILVDSETGGIENRSNTFSGIVMIPEPGALALLAIGLAGLCISRRHKH